MNNHLRHFFKTGLKLGSLAFVLMGAGQCNLKLPEFANKRAVDLTALSAVNPSLLNGTNTGTGTGTGTTTIAAPINLQNITPISTFINPALSQQVAGLNGGGLVFNLSAALQSNFTAIEWAIIDITLAKQAAGLPLSVGELSQADREVLFQQSGFQFSINLGRLRVPPNGSMNGYVRNRAIVVVSSVSNNNPIYLTLVPIQNLNYAGERYRYLPVSNSFHVAVYSGTITSGIQNGMKNNEIKFLNTSGSVITGSYAVEQSGVAMSSTAPAFGYVTNLSSFQQALNACTVTPALSSPPSVLNWAILGRKNNASGLVDQIYVFNPVNPVASGGTKLVIPLNAQQARKDILCAAGTEFLDPGMTCPGAAPPVSCAPGYTYSWSSGSCVLDQESSCQPLSCALGLIFDNATCGCIADPNACEPRSCRSGYVFSNASCSCVANTNGCLPQGCADDHTFDVNTCSCVAISVGGVRPR